MGTVGEAGFDDEGAEGVPSYSLNKTHTHWLIFELLVTVPVTVGDK